MKDGTEIVSGECITETHDIEGKKEYITNRHYYSHYYKKYNHYYITEYYDEENHLRKSKCTGKTEELVYERSQYDGSYMTDPLTGRTYWHHPYYTGYPCYGNHAYSKPYTPKK
ncbi:MAG: hypothetical protein ACRDDX_03170 [Cellulosilyticaceae bacterium]